MSLQENLEKIRNDFDLSNLDPENIGAWPLPVKIMCWLLAALLVVGLSYQVVLKEQQENLNMETQKEATLKMDFEQKVRDAANLEAYRTQMKEMKDSFDALLLQLPKDTEVPGLLDDISNSGQTSGLNFDAIDLLAEKRTDFYIELPIDIKVSGGYHDFGTFVSGIAGLPRIVTLHDFVIIPSAADSAGQSAKDKDKSKDSADIRSTEELSMTIMAKTYRYKSDEEDAGNGVEKTVKSKDGGK